MREIKFRAWDKSKKCFIPMEVYAIITPDFNAFGVMLKDWENYKEGEYFYDNSQVLSQFTGLKDKNGKEIYEGDIITIPVRRILDPSDYGQNEIVSVAWTEFGSWGITEKESLYDYNEEAEVIGNIYENPDLLK